jgi:hypothetical protein
LAANEPYPPALLATHSVAAEIRAALPDDQMVAPRFINLDYFINLVATVKYLILLSVGIIAALIWCYFQCSYSQKDEHETIAFGIECDLERFSFADECKRACLVVIAYCTILAAIFGASEW